MSDDLVKRLQDPPFGTETSERNLMAQAAARIAELEAERDAAREALMKAGIALHVAKREARDAEAQVSKLAEDAAFIQEQRASAMLRRNLNAPEDAHVQTLCERYGYGAVMDAASRLWAREDSMGAFYIGGCIGMKTDAEARAALSAVKREAGE